MPNNNKGLILLFKEVKRITGGSKRIKDQIELQRITFDAKIDRTESCFAGRSRQTEQQYRESAKLAAKSASKWF